MARVQGYIGTPPGKARWQQFLSRLPTNEFQDSWSENTPSLLVNMAFAARVTGRPEYLGPARDLLALAASAGIWSYPGNEQWPLDLCVGETATSVSLAYSWLYAELSPPERELVEKAIVRLAFEPYLRASEAGSFPLGDYGNNWCGVISSGVALAAEVFSAQSSQAQRARPLAHAQVLGVLDHFGRDGGWGEGLGYWGYTLASILRYGVVRSELGADSDILRHPALRRTADFPLYLRLSAGRYANLADAGTLGPTAAALNGLAWQLRDSPTQWLGTERQPSGEWQSFIWRDPTVVPRPPADLPLARAFDSIGWAVMRTGWTDNDTVLALTGGYRTKHSHLDANHLLLHAYGADLLPDQGHYGYPADYFSENGKARCWWSDTRGHNAVLIDGQGQSARVGSGSQITHFMCGPHCDYVRSDATPAYALKARRVARHVVFVRPRFFLVLDDLLARGQAEWQWLAQLAGQETLGPAGATIHVGTAALRLQALEPTSLIISRRSHSSGARYLSLAPADPSARERFGVVLYPWSTAAAPECPARFETSPIAGGRAALISHSDGSSDLLQWFDVGDAPAPIPVTVLSYDTGHTLTGFSAFGPRALVDGANTVVSSEQPLWLSAVVRPGSIVASARAPEGGQKIRLRWPGPLGTVRIDGTPQPGGDATAIAVPAGLHQVQVAVGS